MSIFSRYFWRELYWKIRDFFFPRNKWLTKHIPSGWQDKDALLENILAATIIEFVDGEKGFEVEMARATVSGLFQSVQRPFIIEWFQRINKISSDLDKIWKGKK